MSTLTWIFLYLILPLGLGVLGNVATSWVQSYFKNTSLSMRERKTKALIDEYRLVRWSKGDNLFELRTLAFTIIYIQLAILSISVAIGFMLAFFLKYTLNPSSTIVGFELDVKSLSRLISVIWLVGLTGVGFTLLRAIRQIDRILNVDRFDVYKEKTIAKLKKLGGNPEDLDKEDG